MLHTLPNREFDEDKGKNEDGEAGADGESEEQEVTGITYTCPFLNFPALKHHAHPFYVIYNALYPT